MAKRKIGEVLWLALQCAKRDRRSFVEAYSFDTTEPAVVDALKDIQDFEALQLRLFGTTKSELDAAIDKLKPVSITKLLARDVDDSGE